MTDLPLIPRPAHLELLDSPPFRFDEFTIVVGGSPEEIDVGVRVADLLGRVTGAPVPVRYGDGQPEPDTIALHRVDDLGPGAYRLAVSAERIVIEAGDLAGSVHAAVTLRQAIRRDGGAPAVPAMRVADAPRYPWRGLSIDLARHFLGPDDLRVVISLMAHYKLNVLHLHLTDDQGWRLQIPSRPALTEVSGSTAVDGDPGGYLSVEDWASLITYAEGRGITVVPEVDVPGHVNAALHAVPALNPGGRAAPVYTGIEVGFSRLHADLPATRPFLRDVFAEVAAVTPGEYLHIGGDEVLAMSREEYERLVGIAAAAVRDAGKSVVAWQEVAGVPLPAGSLLQWWDMREDAGPLVRAVEDGARVLLSPADRVYLDMKWGPDAPVGLEWAGHIELRDAYDWEPETLLPVPPEAVAGVEAAVWTETVRTRDDLTLLLLPRLAAVAEVAWTPRELRDWEDFRGRVAGQAPFWDELGVSWYRSPQVDWS